jgi:biopolymer transport protein ExbD
LSPFKSQIKLAALTSLFLLFTFNVPAQKTGKKSPHKTPPPTKVSVDHNRLSAVKYEVTIGPDGKMGLAVLSGFEGQLVRSDQIRKALADYLPEDVSHHQLISPVVVIRPDKDTRIASVIEAAQVSRVSRGANVSVVTPDGSILNVAPEPKFTEHDEIKPNPLFLLVAVKDDGRLYLNNDDTASAKLGPRLMEIFKERENNGVFRPDSNEIEKTVYIRVPPESPFQRVLDIVKTMNESGAGPLFLIVDSDTGVDVIKEIVPVQ